MKTNLLFFPRAYKESVPFFSVLWNAFITELNKREIYLWFLHSYGKAPVFAFLYAFHSVKSNYPRKLIISFILFCAYLVV